MTEPIVALQEALRASPIVDPSLLSAEGAGLMSLGRERHWRFQVVGKRSLVTKPTFEQPWWLVPVEHDSEVIPPRAIKRVRAIYQAGLRPEAFIIAHEAPPLLAPPREREDLPMWGHSADRYLETLTPVVVIGTALVKGLAMVVAVAVPALGALLGLALAAALAVDPRLIAVTPEGEWIEIDRWVA